MSEIPLWSLAFLAACGAGPNDDRLGDEFGSVRPEGNAGFGGAPWSPPPAPGGQPAGSGGTGSPPPPSTPPPVGGPATGGSGGSPQPASGGAGGGGNGSGAFGTGGVGGGSNSGGAGGAGATAGAGGAPCLPFPFPCGTGGTPAAGGAAGAGAGPATGGAAGAGGGLPGFSPSPNNPPECPQGAPENPIGSCLGLPIYLGCTYSDGARTYSCVCDWYHWICF